MSSAYGLAICALMLVYVALTLGLAGLLMGLNLFLAVHMPDNEKLSPYECGYAPVYGQTRSPFTIQYYLVGLLFLIFDLEVSLLYPLGAALTEYGFVIMTLFYIILTLGFVVEIASGALNLNQ